MLLPRVRVADLQPLLPGSEIMDDGMHMVFASPANDDPWPLQLMMWGSLLYETPDAVAERVRLAFAEKGVAV